MIGWGWMCVSRIPFFLETPFEASTGSSDSVLKVLSTFVKEQSILAKVPDGATLQSEAAPQPNRFFTSFKHMGWSSQSSTCRAGTNIIIIEIPESAWAYARQDTSSESSFGCCWFAWMSYLQFIVGPVVQEELKDVRLVWIARNVFEHDGHIVI